MKKILMIIILVNAYLANAVVQPYAEFEFGKHNYKIQKISDGHGVIWGMSFLNQDSLVFTEKTGQILRLNLKNYTVETLKNPPQSVVNGQGGLLDIAVHPDFASNKWIYATYTKKVGAKFTTAVARAELNGNTFSTWTEFFVAQPASSSGVHFGSRLVFDKKGYIFFGVGERGERDDSQKLTTHTGKMIRLKENGDIPLDNPFYNDPHAKKEIWSYGHRNPQGLFYDESTDTLYESEHGPQGGDEINIIKKGANYGWPVITYGKEYGTGADIGEGTHKLGMEQPLKYFIPSIGPSGLTLLNGSVLPDLKDFLVSGSLPLTHLNFIRQNGEGFCELRLMESVGDRIRGVLLGPDRRVYISTDSGKILRIELGETLKAPDMASCPKVKETILFKTVDINSLERTYTNLRKHVLEPYCGACHFTDGGALPRLETYNKALTSVVPGVSSQSQLFISLVTGTMPPSLHLDSRDPAIIPFIEEWINLGAPE
jgi:aldose sugar dehydrogenase